MKEAGIGGHYGITSKTKLSDNPRVYTESDCDRLGFLFTPNTCVELKDTTKNADGSYKLVPDNVKTILSEKCKGLNETPAESLRSECNVDDVLVGKQINAFSIKVKGKQVEMPGDALRVYTEDECKDLGGNTMSVIGNIINLLRDESGVSKGDLKKFTDQVVNSDEKEEYFICQGSIPFSTVCIEKSFMPGLSSLPSFSSSSSSSSSSGSTFFGDIAESAKTHFKKWLNI